MLTESQVQMLQNLKSELEAPEMVEEVVEVVETRPSFSSNPDPAPKVPYTGPRTGRGAGPWQGPRVVMRWGKVTRSFREPVLKSPEQIAADRSYRQFMGGR